MEELNTNFYKWFGNSKVVGTDGNPLICYHGTSRGGFTEFKPKTSYKGKPKQQLDLGSHFSVDKNYSSGYSGSGKNSKVYECYLKIENPLYTNQMFYREDNESLFLKYLDFITKIFKVKIDGNYYYDKSGNKKEQPQSLMINSFLIDKIPSSKLYSGLMEFGFDGVFHEPYNREDLYSFKKHPVAYVVLNPNQIKSIDNNGEFSLDSNNIYEDNKMNKTFKITENQLNEIRNYLSEATASEIHQKYYPSISDADFNKIVSADPISSNLERNNLGEYGKWLLNLYKNKQLKLEDLYKATEYIPIFNKAKKSKKLQQPDINRYNSLPDMYVAIEQFIGDVTISNTDKAKETKSNEAKVVYEDDEWKVIIPKTEAAACLYGANTQWCTAAKNNNKFDDYNDQGRLYININKKTGRKYQFHIESSSFMDERDNDIDEEEFLRGEKGLLEFYINNVDKNFILLRYDNIGRWSNRIVTVKLNGKYNFLKFGSKELISDKWFDQVWGFDLYRGWKEHNLFAKVKLNEKFNYIDDNGNLVSNNWFYLAGNPYGWGQNDTLYDDESPENISELLYGHKIISLVLFKYGISGKNQFYLDADGNLYGMDFNLVSRNVLESKTFKITSNQLNEIKNHIKEEKQLENIKLPKNIVDSLKQHKTSLGDHPAFPPGDELLFQEKLLLKRYNEVGNEVKKIHGLKADTRKDLVRRLHNDINNCKLIEKPIRKELEKICYEFVCDEFGVDYNQLDLVVGLKDTINLEFEPNIEPLPLEDIQFEEIDEINNLEKEVYKRRLINSFIQGAAVRLSSKYSKIINKIYDLSPQLPALYHNIVTINNYLTFISEPIPDINNLAGFSTVNLSDDEPKIYTEAVIFPVLVFETVKGVMELLAANGLPESRENAEYVVGKADFLLAENWDRRFGVGMFDILNSMVEEKELFPDIFTYLISLDVDEFNHDMREILGKTKKGRKVVDNICRDVKRDKSFGELDNQLGNTSKDDGFFSIEELAGDDDDIYFKPEELLDGDDVIAETVALGNIGDFSYDIPAFGDKETLNHKDMIQGGIQESKDYYEHWDVLGTAVYDTIQEFLHDKSNGINKKRWRLIPAEQYKNALIEFMRYGEFMRFPTKYVFQWANLITNNVAALSAMTQLAGHTRHFPYDDFCDAFGFDRDDEESDMFEKYNNNYDECSKYLEQVGFYDWMLLPDGTDAMSDYGLDPLLKLIHELEDADTAEQKIVVINKCLDVVHQRGDLASAFISGGSKSLNNITFNEMVKKSGSKLINEERSSKYGGWKNGTLTYDGDNYKISFYQDNGGYDEEKQKDISAWFPYVVKVNGETPDNKIFLCYAEPVDNQLFKIYDSTKQKVLEHILNLAVDGELIIVEVDKENEYPIK